MKAIPKHGIRRGLLARGRQAGAALIFALLALVALGFAAVALIRSVDTGSLVMGNLAFKHDATLSGDRIAEQAVTWLNAQLGGTALDSDNTAAGYYATALPGLDPTGNTNLASRALIDWDADGCAYGAHATCLAAGPTINLPGGNRGRYVISRLCLASGSANSATNTCAVPISSAAGQGPTRGEIKYGTARLAPVGNAPYYRILVRVVGGRGTVSTIETIVAP